MKNHYSYLLPLSETKNESNRKQNNLKMEEVQESIRKANATLLEVEKGRRNAKSTLERYQGDVKVIKTIMMEEKKKSDEEIASILSSFNKIEKIVLDRRETFHETIQVN